MAARQHETQTIDVLERVSTFAPLEVAVLRTGGFSLERDLIAATFGVLESWLRQLADRFRLQPALWLPGAALHSTRDVNLLVEHAREWMPDLGLGIRPNGEPPRMLNPEDLSQLKWDQMPQPKHETAFHLRTGAQAAETALPLFGGTGAILYCLLDASVDVYLSEQRQLWLPNIKDPAFRAHSFYVPFLDRKRLKGQSASVLFEWLGRAVVYLRESPEDDGILIVSSLAGALDQLDLQLNQS
jgi:hypothetical protein